MSLIHRRAAQKSDRGITRFVRPALETLEDRLTPSADGLPDIVGPLQTAEGQSYVLQLDAAGHNVNYWTIQWGDGSPEETVAGNQSQAAHVFLDGPASPTILVKAVEHTPLTLVQWQQANGGNGHYYGLTASSSTWTAAETLALSHGGHLASITSQAEQTFLVNTFLASPSDRRIFWIGINDQAVEGQYVWSSGELVSYTNWQAPGEPNNFNGKEDYGSINWHYGNFRPTGVRGSWNDAPNDGLNGALNAPEPYVGLMEFSSLPSGPVTSRSLAVTVANVAPTASIAGPDASVRGQELTFTLLASDPSAADQQAGFTFTLDWNGDGIVDETVDGPSGVQVSHAFVTSGTHLVRVTALDRDDGESLAAEWNVEVSAVAIQNGVLVVGGTDGNDWITLSNDGKSGVRVEINGQDEGVFQPSAGVVVHGLRGNDTIHGYRGAVQLYGDEGDDYLFGGPGNGFLFGGDGDDFLHGGGGSDVLVGGDGADTLRGGGGRDILLGGFGADRIFATDRNDLVFAGATAFDSNVTALSALMAEWTALRSRPVRLANLRDGSGSPSNLNAPFFLDANTLFDDSARDRVIGRRAAILPEA